MVVQTRGRTCRWWRLVYRRKCNRNWIRICIEHLAFRCHLKKRQSIVKGCMTQCMRRLDQPGEQHSLWQPSGTEESLIEWRRKWDSAISPLLLRISIGLEDFEHLKADLELHGSHMLTCSHGLPGISFDHLHCERLFQDKAGISQAQPKGKRMENSYESPQQEGQSRAPFHTADSQCSQQSWSSHLRQGILKVSSKE